MTRASQREPSRVRVCPREASGQPAVTAKVQITLDTYSHVMPGMQAQAVSVFAGAMGGF